MSWDPSAHPRAAAGSAGGGQFAPLGYDSAKKTGTGYGKAKGDPRVKTAQAALNRLGLTDSKGRKLAADGKLGPLTTQSIMSAQRRLGVKADGKITPAFLAKLKAAKALPGGKPGAVHKKAALAKRPTAPPKKAPPETSLTPRAK